MELPGDIREMVRDFRGVKEMHTPHGDASALEIADSIITRLEFLSSRDGIKRIMPIGGGEIEIIPNATNEATKITSHDGVYYHGVTVTLKPEEILSFAMLLLERYNEIGVNRINAAEETNV